MDWHPIFVAFFCLACMSMSYGHGYMKEHLLIFIDKAVASKKGTDNIQEVKKSARKFYGNKPAWVITANLSTSNIYPEVHRVHDDTYWNATEPCKLSELRGGSSCGIFRSLYEAIRRTCKLHTKASNSRLWLPGAGRVRGSVAYRPSLKSKSCQPVFAVANALGYKAGTPEQLELAIKAVAVGTKADVKLLAMAGLLVLVFITLGLVSVMCERYRYKSNLVDIRMILQLSYPRLRLVRKFIFTKGNLNPEEFIPKEYTAKVKSDDVKSGKSQENVEKVPKAAIERASSKENQPSRHYSKVRLKSHTGSLGPERVVGQSSSMNDG